MQIRGINENNAYMSPGSVAERSKALVLGTSLFGGMGSNPIAAITALLVFAVLLRQNNLEANLYRANGRVA